MISDPDIFRAANLLIDQRGPEAGDFAAGRADVLLEEGDRDGAVVWCRILDSDEEFDTWLSADVEAALSLQRPLPGDRR